MNLVPGNSVDKVDFFGMHIKFQGDRKSVLADQVVSVIEILETDRLGYKVFGKESTFPTPRCVIYSGNYKTLNDVAQKIVEQFKCSNHNAAIVLYSKGVDGIQYHRVEGDFHGCLYSEIEKNINMSDVPMNH